MEDSFSVGDGIVLGGGGGVGEGYLSGEDGRGGGYLFRENLHGGDGFGSDKMFFVYKEEEE